MVQDTKKVTSKQEERIWRFLQCVPFFPVTDKAITNLAKRFAVSEEVFRAFIALEMKKGKEGDYESSN